LGLGLAHHHSIIIFALPFLFFEKKFISVDGLLIFVFIPFYFYPFITSHFNPAIDWENAKTFSGLIRLFTRSSYGTFSAYFGSTPNLINQLTTLLSTFILIIGDFKPLVIFFIIAGIFFLKKRGKFFFNYLIITFFLYLLFLYLTNFNLSYTFSLATFERYLIGLYLILVFFFAFGIEGIFHFLLKIQEKLKKFKTAKIIYIYYLVLIIYLFINFFNNLKIISSLKKADHFEKFSKTILSIPEKNSILLLKSDLTFFPISYYYYYLKLRPDLILIFPPMLSRFYYREKLIKKYPNLIINQSSLPMNFINKSQPIYSEVPYDNHFLPFGILWRYYPEKQFNKKEVQKIIKFNYDFWIKNKNLIDINSSQQKILYYKALWEFYQDKLLSFIIYLIETKDYETLNNFLINLLQQYNLQKYDYLFNLIHNYFSERGICQKLTSLNQKAFCY